MAMRLHAAAIHLLRGLRPVDQQSGLSAARLSALSVLVFGGPRTLGQLAEAEQVTPATMSRLVAALEADGLVRRAAVAGDRRATRLDASAKGRRVLERARRRRVERLAGLLARLDTTEIKTIDRAAAIIERVVREA